MGDLRKIFRDSVSSFSSLSIDSYGREISGEDYTDLHCFLEDVREKYEKDFLIRFLDHKADDNFYVEVMKIDESSHSDEFKYERLMRAVLHRTQERGKCEDYWIENGRLFLRGDFGNKSCIISFHGVELYNLELADNGDQIREYVPIDIKWPFLREFRFRQIRQELNCPECGSEPDSPEHKTFRCQDCGSIDLTELSFPLTVSVERIVSHIEENYTDFHR